MVKYIRFILLPLGTRKLIREMVSEFNYGLMDLNMKECGEMDNAQAKEE